MISLVCDGWGGVSLEEQISRWGYGWGIGVQGYWEDLAGQVSSKCSCIVKGLTSSSSHQDRLIEILRTNWNQVTIPTLPTCNTFSCLLPFLSKPAHPQPKCLTSYQVNISRGSLPPSSVLCTWNCSYMPWSYLSLFRWEQTVLNSNLIII